MNPEEGWLRPQLLDRFGLMVDVREEQTRERRAAVLSTVLRFDVGAVEQEAGRHRMAQRRTPEGRQGGKTL